MDILELHSFDRLPKYNFLIIFLIIRIFSRSFFGGGVQDIDLKEIPFPFKEVQKMLSQRTRRCLNFKHIKKINK